MADSSRVRHIELHTCLLRHDGVATEQLIAELHLLLRHKLRRSFPRVDADDLVDAATDAILAYVAEPHRFDVTRDVPLAAYVGGIAANILRSRMRSQLRRSAREDRYAVHSMRVCQTQASNHGAHAVLVQQLRRALAVVCSARELTAVMAWLEGRDYAVVATHLGAGELQPPCQRREVELFTRRVTKRLQRHLRAPELRQEERAVFTGLIPDFTSRRAPLTWRVAVCRRR
jgi:hypothetical protein